MKPNDEILTQEDRQERISTAFAHAVAARAGYTTSVYDLDRTGIDLLIQAGGTMRPQLGLQMKATTTLNLTGDRLQFSFRMLTKHYDWLRLPSQVPRLLVVLDMPQEENDWMTINDTGLIMRRQAYWKDLKDEPETDRNSITVNIPTDNVFNVDSLRDHMERSRAGRL